MLQVKNLNIDESLVHFEGRMSFKQYITSKRASFGIKLYQPCTFIDILLDFMVYHGNLAQGLVRMEEGSLTTERIPVTLMQKYLDKGHISLWITSTLSCFGRILPNTWHTGYWNN